MIKPNKSDKRTKDQVSHSFEVLSRIQQSGKSQEIFYQAWVSYFIPSQAWTQYQVSLKSLFPSLKKSVIIFFSARLSKRKRKWRKLDSRAVTAMINTRIRQQISFGKGQSLMHSSFLAKTGDHGRIRIYRRSVPYSKVPQKRTWPGKKMSVYSPL